MSNTGKNTMFCFQCQETMQNTGCTRTGLCGKKPELAQAQDVLVHVTRCLCAVTTQLRKERKEIDEQVNRQICRSLVMTMTDTCFDTEAIAAQTGENLRLLKELFPLSENKETLPGPVVFLTIVSTPDAITGEAGVLTEEDEDIRSFREVITYGVKGIAAFVCEADHLGAEDPDIHIFMQRAMAQLLDNTMTGGNLLALVMETGRYVVRALDLLDQAKRAAYGDPETVTVSTAVRGNPAILVSGSDLRDLELLLEQTAGTGVDVYTYGELAAAHAYPYFRRYPHLAGHYGGAWWKQKEEFESFHGPILVTTDKLTPPRGPVRDRLFTTGQTGWPGCRHIEEMGNGMKDFSELIALAKTCEAPAALSDEPFTIGFCHTQADALAPRLQDAVREGSLQKIILLAGDDGRSKTRGYYTDFVKALPEDTIILTAGEVSERFVRQTGGEAGGIPRVIHAGQLSDIWSLILLILKLRETAGADSLSQLPLTWNFSWYSQRSTAVLLALMYMDIRHIYLGPSMPAFLSQNVRNVMEKYMGLDAAGSTALEDVQKQLGGTGLLIRPDMIVGDIVQEYPSLVPVMAQNGLHCIGCGVSKIETLEQACMTHGIDPQEMLELLNKELNCL